MKKQILKYSLIFLTLLTAFFSWSFVSRAIELPGSSDWLIPAIWLFLFFVISPLAIILVKEFYLLLITFIISLGMSFIFVQNIWHSVSFLLAILFITAGAVRIREDMKLNIKISLWKSVRMGRVFLIVALSIIVTSQYYFQIKKMPPVELVPKFEIGGKFNDVLTSKILSIISPDFNIKEGEENLTVDQFILQTQKNQMKKEEVSSEIKIDAMIDEKFGKDISEAERSLIKQSALEEIDFVTNNSQNVMLEEGRKEFSKMAGVELQGSEKVSDVFSEMINNKISELLGPNSYESDEISFVPAVLAILLFLTMFSIGSFLSPLGLLMTITIFWIMKKSKLVEVKKVPTEKEAIDL